MDKNNKHYQYLLQRYGELTLMKENIIFKGQEIEQEQIKVKKELIELEKSQKENEDIEDKDLGND